MADAPWPKSAPKALHEKSVGSRITSLFEGVQRLVVSTRQAADAIATHLAATKTSVSVRENGTQIRVSPALFNTDADIDRFLTVAEGLK